MITGTYNSAITGESRGFHLGFEFSEPFTYLVLILNLYHYISGGILMMR